MPVAGYFSNIPAEHDGSEDFSFRIYFSEGVATTAEALRDQVLSASGGVVSSVDAVGGEGRIWAVSVTPDSRGMRITIEIEPDLDCELPEAICTTDGRRLFNRLELMVEAKEYNPPTGAPTISGTAEVGETLTSDTSRISDADGLTGATFSHQWVSYDGNAHTDIAGATGSTYIPVYSDEGSAFRVRVSFTDDAGFRESLTSALARSERPYGLTATVSDGVVVVTWKLPAGWPYGSIYQLLRNRPELGEAEPLVYVRYTQSGGTAYTDADVAPGVLYVYRVKGVNFLGFTREASEPVEIRTAESTVVENSPATGAPAIGGAPQVGETLTVDTSGIADTDGLGNATFSYQWLADDRDISEATGSTYTLTDVDEGRSIKVRVSFTDDADNPETLTSAATAAVESRPNSPATGAPAISGTAEVGETLNLDTSAIADTDGMSNAVFTYQWLRMDGAAESTISGATSSTYVVAGADEGHAIKVGVSFTDDKGFSESITSAGLDIPVVPLEGHFDAATVPASHDGVNTTFTFQLYFSVEPTLSFEKVRDDVLTLTNGEVTAVRRTNPQSANPNSRWEITVQPSGSNALTVALNPTPDCGLDSAVCTSSGKMLSNSASITVAGP